VKRSSVSYWDLLSKSHSQNECLNTLQFQTKIGSGLPRKKLVVMRTCQEFKHCVARRRHYNMFFQVGFRYLIQSCTLHNKIKRLGIFTQQLRYMYSFHSRSNSSCLCTLKGSRPESSNLQNHNTNIEQLIASL